MSLKVEEDSWGRVDRSSRCNLSPAAQIKLNKFHLFIHSFIHIYTYIPASEVQLYHLCRAVDRVIASQSSHLRRYMNVTNSSASFAAISESVAAHQSLIPHQWRRVDTEGMCDFGKYGFVLYDALSGRHGRFQYGRTAEVDLYIYIYIYVQNTVGTLTRHAQNHGRIIITVVV